MWPARLFHARKSPPAPQRPPRARLQVEWLEARQVLSTLIGLTPSNHLLTFDSASPGTITRDVAISGLLPNELVGAIDYRPANGQLYAVAGTPSAARLLILNPVTGAATQVGQIQGIPRQADIGLGFDPVADQLRLTADQLDANVRINPNNAAVTIDRPLQFASNDPSFGQSLSVVGIAYTNNVAGASSTTLFGIDTSSVPRLVRIGSPGGSPVSPNTGQVFTIGPLGVGFSTEELGFDIGADGTALASLSPGSGSPSDLYQIDLTSGSATRLGKVGSGVELRGLAIMPPVVTPPLSLFTKYVTALYGDVLERSPESGGFEFWIDKLDRGVFNRAEVAERFLNSTERQRLVVEKFYQIILSRTGSNDPGSRYWIMNLVHGTMSEADVAIGFVTSDEFKSRFPTTRQFVTEIYRSLLTRPLGTTEGEISFQIKRIDSGLMTRAGVALSFLTSAEAFNKGIDDYYTTYLRRKPTATELQNLLTIIQSTFTSPIQEQAQILASTEYFMLVNR